MCSPSKTKKGKCLDLTWVSRASSDLADGAREFGESCVAQDERLQSDGRRGGVEGALVDRLEVRVDDLELGDAAVGEDLGGDSIAFLPFQVLIQAHFRSIC